MEFGHRDSDSTLCGRLEVSMVRVVREALSLFRRDDWECGWYGVCCLSGLCCKSNA